MKGGKLAIEYLALIVLGLILLVVLAIFATGIRDKILEAMRHFLQSIVGRS